MFMETGMTVATIMGLFPNAGDASAGVATAGVGATAAATKPPKLQHLGFGSRIQIQTLLERRHAWHLRVDAHLSVDAHHAQHARQKAGCKQNLTGHRVPIAFLFNLFIKIYLSIILSSTLAFIQVFTGISWDDYPTIFYYVVNCFFVWI
jgi:hypothetical protein